MAMKKEKPWPVERHDASSKSVDHEYPQSYGRVPIEDCPHPAFLDYVFPYTGICLECGAEHLCCYDWQTLEPGQEIYDVRQGVRFQAEGRILTDDELTNHRHVYHAAFGHAGWTHPDPTTALPPPALRAQLNNKPPDRVKPRRSLPNPNAAAHAGP